MLAALLTLLFNARRYFHSIWIDIDYKYVPQKKKIYLLGKERIIVRQRVFIVLDEMLIKVSAKEGNGISNRFFYSSRWIWSSIVDNICSFSLNWNEKRLLTIDRLSMSVAFSFCFLSGRVVRIGIYIYSWCDNRCWKSLMMSIWNARAA